MKFTSRKLLAAALLAVIPMSSALACTTANWTNDGSLIGAPLAGDPSDGVARYSGECGLSAAVGNAVTNNAPENDGTYRARFYVHTGSTGVTQVFRATTLDDNAGNEVIGVSYNAGTGAFDFAQNGTAAGSVSGILANRWYSVEVLYVAGDTFSAEVAGAGTFTGSLAPGAAGAGTIGSHTLGAISGGSGTVRVDAFESTRSADTAIGRLCRGDATGDGASVNSGDGIAIRNEFLLGTLAQGQADCTEDGIVNSGDGLCVRNLFLNGNGSCN